MCEVQHTAEVVSWTLRHSWLFQWEQKGHCGRKRETSQGSQFIRMLLLQVKPSQALPSPPPTCCLVHATGATFRTPLSARKPSLLFLSYRIEGSWAKSHCASCNRMRPSNKSHMARALGKVTKNSYFGCVLMLCACVCLSVG